MQTARLLIRPIEEADLDALVKLDGGPAVRAAVDPFDEHIPDDADDRREYERRLIGHPGFRSAVDRESGEVLGWFQLQEAEGRPGELELGYRLDPSVWGRGLATEGAAALVAEALERSDIRRVFAHTLLSNTASIRVMEKIGMTYAGPWAYKGLPGAEYEALAPASGD
jgi:RimJ/RimL family protein N-acetyltransferase